MTLLLSAMLLCQADNPVAGLKALEGRWNLESVEHEGKQLKPTQVRLVIKGDKLTTYRDGKEELGGVLAVDPVKQWMNFESAKGEVLVVALYNLDGDTLTICIGADDQRPKELAAPKGSGGTVSVYKRKKD